MRRLPLPFGSLAGHSTGDHIGRVFFPFAGPSQNSTVEPPLYNRAFNWPYTEYSEPNMLSILNDFNKVIWPFELLLSLTLERPVRELHAEAVQLRRILPFELAVRSYGSRSRLFYLPYINLADIIILFTT